MFEQKLQLCDTCVHVNNVLLYVLNYCVLFVLFCIVFNVLFLQNINTNAGLESVFLQLFFKAWNHVYVAVLEKIFTKNDWMRISEVSTNRILTWYFLSDNCVWILAVFIILTLILLQNCQKVQELFWFVLELVWTSSFVGLQINFPEK